jgi:mannan endo-1,4-beta-mannosidase
MVKLFLSMVNNWHDYGGRSKCISWVQAVGENVTIDNDFYINVVCH